MHPDNQQVCSSTTSIDRLFNLFHLKVQFFDYRTKRNSTNILEPALYRIIPFLIKARFLSTQDRVHWWLHINFLVDRAVKVHRRDIKHINLPIIDFSQRQQYSKQGEGHCRSKSCKAVDTFTSFIFLGMSISEI